MSKPVRREQAFLQLLNAIAVAANEAGTVEEALQRALDDVCAYTGWAVGHAYLPAGDGWKFSEAQAGGPTSTSSSTP